MNITAQCSVNECSQSTSGSIKYQFLEVVQCYEKQVRIHDEGLNLEITQNSI